MTVTYERLFVNRTGVNTIIVPTPSGLRLTLWIVFFTSTSCTLIGIMVVYARFYFGREIVTKKSWIIDSTRHDMSETQDIRVGSQSKESFLSWNTSKVSKSNTAAAVKSTSKLVNKKSTEMSEQKSKETYSKVTPVKSEIDAETLPSLTSLRSTEQLKRISSSNIANSGRFENSENSLSVEDDVVIPIN